MEFLSDDPTYPAILLGVAALVFFAMLKVTQQGKYLLFTVATVVALALLLLVERIWVTENERIEDVIYGLARAVAASDAGAAAAFLTDDCQLERTPDRGNVIVRAVVDRFAGPVTQERLAQELSHYEFDYLRVARLETNAGLLTGRGTAECLIHLSAKNTEITAFRMTPPSGMGWSFGLREEAPHVWKIARITPGRMARD